jgi:formylglycine-generating enzyme
MDPRDRSDAIPPLNSITRNLMKAKSLLVSALLLAIAPVHATVTIQWSTVNHAGNAPDSTGFGSVAHEYNISTYEITNAQYTAFLNAADPSGTNTYSLYNGSMGTSPRGGISFVAGAEAGSKFVVKTNMGDKPVNFVSWFDAARMSNWLRNGQGSGSTETGSYDLLGAMSGIGFTRASGAIGLPTENEWYKAAYYAPGGDLDGYWLNATRSNTFTPTLAAADLFGNISNPGADVINFGSGADWNSQNGNLTSVGSAGPASASYFGTYDQGGNVYEINDATSVNLGGSRGMRGGAYNDTHFAARATTRNFFTSYAEADNLGFRLAYAVPEPSSMMVLSLGIGAPLLRRRRS